MSNVYSLEPPTKGKVTVKTSLGDLDVELWPKEAPKACRNFVQLCMEGYYNKTTFHRVIKDFMVQGGDPTGTGTGGESIYGGAFEDEFHSRLQFRRRALVACANEADKPNSNKSQFFITLGRSDWLTKKNTIFGTVTGDTVYNLMKFNDLEVDGEDRPTDAPHIVGTEVVWNPFDDIIPRVVAGGPKEEGSAKRQERNRGRVRNKNLLSFGDDEEDGDEDGGNLFLKPKRHEKSAPQKHLRLEQEGRENKSSKLISKEGNVKVTSASGKALAVARRVEDKGEEESNPPSTSNKAESKGAGSSSATALAERMMSRVSELRREMNDAGKESTKGSAELENQQQGKAEQGGKKAKGSKPSLKKALNMKLARLKDSELYTETEARRRTIKRKRKLTSDREQETLARLQKFTSGLREDKTKKKKDSKVKANRVGDSEVNEQLERRKNMPAAWRVDDYLTAEGADEDDQDLRSHVLSFQKGQRTSRESDMIKRDSVDDYVVHDPLLEKGKAKWNRKQAEKKRATNRRWNN